MDCGACHSPDSWEIPSSYWHPPTLEHNSPDWTQDTLRFHHDQTAFPLTGQHQGLDCRDCHESLVFEEANAACISCHTDVHQNTVGDDCLRCHSTESWLIDDIFTLHQENGFPLLGAHATADCAACHRSETALRFDRLGNECVNCHLEDFNTTTQPNHLDAGFSTNCIECHRMDASDWGSESIDHSFFPLELGHDIQDCTACHTVGDFSNTPTDCFECHSAQFENALNPNHLSAGFSTQCVDCHTTNPGWSPAEFLGHDDSFFPIYSGKHEGEWNLCTDCHIGGNFQSFSCIDCHEHNDPNDLAEDHDDVSGYQFSSSACYSCHPTGEE